jgi:hypothetical protein
MSSSARSCRSDWRARAASTTLALALAAATTVAQDPRRHGADSPDRGLPRTPLAFAPYHADAAHPTNDLFRRLWLQQMAPAEVAAVVPRGAAPAWAPGWVHGKRAGTPADARWFGGDGRLLPLERLDDDAARAVREQLSAFAAGGNAAAQVREQPALAVLFQHDLLRVAERLLDTGGNADLLPLLQRAALAVALDANALAALADPLRGAIAAGAAELADATPAALGGRAPGREVLRKSTRLFDAEKTLLWSRVFLAHPEGDAALAALLPGPDTKGRGPEVPIGFRGVLVQGIVAIDRDGVPRATPVTFDVRAQHLANRDALAATNATWSRDGVDFAIWQLEREGLRRGEPAAFFRRIEADDQDLFRDYGTAKHTTYRGQCSLCHRVSDTPEPQLGGFPILRPHAGAAFASTGDERLRLAEQQAAKLWTRLPR